MATRHMTLRIEAETLRRLEAQSRAAGQTRSQLAKTLLDEGLRMAAHPGIVFRAGPAGRRPGLVGGPDIWEVARVLKGVEARGEEAIAQAGALTGLAPQQVATALRYYAEYQTDIDDWLRRVDEAAAATEATWRRERDLLRA